MDRVRRLLVVMVAVVGMLAFAASAHATTWTVTTTTDSNDGSCMPSLCSLRDAVAAALPGDTVSIPASTSHYAVSLGEIPITVAPLTIEGAGASSSVIDAGGSSRVFHVTATPATSQTITVQGVTITGGHATVSSGCCAGGGAIMVDDVSSTIAVNLSLVNTVVTGNSVTASPTSCCTGGGGIYSNGGSITLTGSTVSHNSLTIMNNSSCCEGGGGIYDDYSAITLTGSTVSQNTATVTSSSCCHGGGGIYGDGSSGNSPIMISGSQVSDNTFTLNGGSTDTTSQCCSGGGGVYQDSDSPASVTNSTLDGNSATINDGNCCHGGGAIYMDVGGSGPISLTVTGSTQSNNTATVNGPSGANLNLHCCSGGGADAGFGPETLTNSTLDHNTSSVNAGDCCQGGGAINVDGAKTSLTVLGTTISNNSALLVTAADPSQSGGGGVYEDQSGAAHNTYTNSTISGNSTNIGLPMVAEGGGGIYASSTTSTTSDTLANSTVAANSAPSALAGGIYDFGTVVQSKNSIVANNSAHQFADCYATNSPTSTGTLTSLGYNLEDSPDTCSFTATSDKVVPAASVGLAVLGSNGGPTQTMALLAGSPAIDAGNPAGCTDPAGILLITDQRGEPRPDSGEPQCDIGAFESQPPTLSGLTVSPKKFSAVGRKVKGKCVKPTKKNKAAKPCTRPAKLTISYSLTTGANVTFMLELKARGRKVKGKCVKPTSKNKHKPGCKLLRKVGGPPAQTGKTGRNSFTFARKLSPGTYLLTATATGGNSQTATFKVKR